MTRFVGHGVDIVELDEFEKLIKRSGDSFVGRCFTEHEQGYAGDGPNRVARLAARFAAKEAVLKALGTGWTGGITWKDVEIIHQPSGAPAVQISGVAARLAAEKGISGFHVSLSHTARLATASVIAVSDDSATDV
jgi:holo-[acyl-carrier protein] synthase